MSRRVTFIINGLLAVALLAALSLAVWGWQELPASRGYAALVLGSFGTLGISLAFRLPIDVRFNLTLAGLTSLLAAWLASWILHSPPESIETTRRDTLQAAAQRAGVNFDARSRRAVLADLRSSGVDAYPTLSAWALFDSDVSTAPGSFTTPPLLPLAGRSRTTTVACNENGEYLIVETDRYGFNNPDAVYDATSPVLLLGDSFIFGYCVRPGQDLAGRLRARGVEVVNLGYPGTGPLIQLAQLREYGSLIRPAAILWFYYNGNDAVNLRDEYDQPGLRRYLEPEYRQNLATRQVAIDTFWAEQVDWEAPDMAAHGSLRRILLLQPLRALVGRALAARRGSDEPPAGDAFEVVLQQWTAEAERLDAPLYFVFLPTYGQFVDSNPRSRARVLAAVRAHGVPVVDFEERLRRSGDPLQYFPFRQHAHYTETGYALLAEQVLDLIAPGSIDENELRGRSTMIGG